MPDCPGCADTATRASTIARRPHPTTHSAADDINEKATITRERHPFEGQSLEIVERRRHNGEPHLLLKLPDGSRLRVPARWTAAMGSKAGATASADVLAPTGGSKAIAPVELLFRTRILVDSLLRRAATSSAVRNQHEGMHEEPTCTVRAQSARDGSSCGVGTTPIRAKRGCDAAAGGIDGAQPGGQQQRKKRSRLEGGRR